MANPHNNDDFDDELLSAYVDDELTPAERQAVEQRLRTDAGARKLVDELRELSGVIRALPRQATPPRLRDQVLAEVDAADNAHEGPISIPINRWEGYRRGMAWSALAIAATLMLMFTQPADDEGELADATAKPEAAEQKVSNAKSRVDRGLAPAPEMRAAGGSESSGPPATGAASAGAPALQKQLEGESPRPAAPMSAAPAESPLAETMASQDSASGLSAAAEARLSTARGGALAKSSAETSAVAESAVASGFGMVADVASADKLVRSETPIVELQDIDGRGSQRLKELLAQNKIELTGDDPAERPAAAQQPAGDAPPRGEAILVQGSPMQVANFLADCETEYRAFAALAPASESKERRDAALTAADGPIDESARTAPASGVSPQAAGDLGGGSREESFDFEDRRPDNPAGSADGLSADGNRAGRARLLSADEYREVIAALPAVRDSGRLAVPAEAVRQELSTGNATSGSKSASPAPAPDTADREESRPADGGDSEQIQVLILLRREP
jgi:anti-sigma factor RsiW